MTTWWAADAAFLGRLNKAQLAGAVAEGASAELAAPLAKLPKTEAVQRAALALEGRGWLPAPLRTGVGVGWDREDGADIADEEVEALAA